MSFRIFLLGLFLVVPAVKAQEAVPAEPATAETPTAAAETAPTAHTQQELTSLPRSKAERDDMTARAATLHTESKQRKDEAEKVYATAKVDCWKKFLVSACLEDSRIAHRKEISMSKRQEREAQALERNVSKYDAAERAKLRDEENARRDAENAKKAEKYRAKRAAEEQKRQERGN